jgi:glutamyl-tRNA reductase
MSPNHPLFSEPSLIEIGTDHTLSPVALRERLALGEQAATQLLHTLHQSASIEEVAVLSTCNRTEIYFIAQESEQAIQRAARAFAALLGDQEAALEGVLVTRTGLDALRHLCAVASGLESMVMAEGQILGQVREAGERAQHLGTAGVQLHAAFRAAVTCGKRVRAETAIGRADVSVSSVLIDLLAGEIPDWQAQRVLLIGAGRMNQVTAAGLHRHGAGSIVVTSRTIATARGLAETVGGSVIPLHRVPEEARQATLIISATRSPGLMLTPEMLVPRPATPLRVVDLAVPRDVDPAVGRLPGVRLLDIDAIKQCQERQGLAEALATANRLVDEAAQDWLVWCRTRDAVPLIADLRAHVDQQRDIELARTLALLDHLTEADQARVREMANRLVNKMFHHLAVRMKKAAADPELGAQYLAAARFLFQREEHVPGAPGQSTQTMPATPPLEAANPS